MTDAMRRRDDPLLAGEAVERLNYATGMLLSARDFRDEQTFHRQALALMLRHTLGWGTLCGLKVTVRREPSDTTRPMTDAILTVAPGLALDRAGRIILMETPQQLSLRRWVERPSAGTLTPVAGQVVADIFLALAAAGVGLTPAFADGPFDALDAAVPKRVRERASLTLTPRAAGDPLPVNTWPGDLAAQRERVLDQRPLTPADFGPDATAPLEYPAGFDRTAVFLARVTLPVAPLPGAGTTGLTLDLAAGLTQPDESKRPIITMPGHWLGQV